MPLGVYNLNSQDEYEKYSDDRDTTIMSNPVTTTHHGRDGDIHEKQLYLKSDDSHDYSNIQVKAVSTSSQNDIGIGSYRGTTGWGVKLMTDPGHSPTEAEWAAIEYGVPCDISDIGSTEVAAFWMRIESPRGIAVGNKDNIKLLLLYTDTP